MTSGILWRLLRLMRAVLKALLLFFIVILLFLCICSIVRNYEEFETKKLFHEYRGCFVNSLSQDSHRVSLFNSTRRVVVSEELNALGVEEIYVVDENVYFELSDRVLWRFPQGILYAKTFDDIPSWYVTERIDENWYYYRIVS